MAEPTATTAAGVSVTVLAVTLLGPTAGPWVAIFACAVAGSLWPLSGAKTGGWGVGAALMARCIATSLILTGLIAGFIERKRAEYEAIRAELEQLHGEFAQQPGSIARD